MEKSFYSLTSPQKSIYLTEEYYKGTNINNIGGPLTIKQPVDFDKLILAIKQFIKQNDGCRIMLSNEVKEVKQFISEYQDFNIEIVDISSEKGLYSLTDKVISKPFSLYNSYLFEFVVFRFPDNTGGFIIKMHHIIADSWTIGIAINEIIEIYSSYINNIDFTPKDTALYSYKNYISSEEEYKLSDKYKNDKDYWNEVFSTIPETATIPSIHSNATSNFSINALREQFSIPSNLLDRINEYCKAQKVSLFNFLTAIYSIYISRVSNLEDFCLGTPILNRSNFKEKNTAGMFINALPIRVHIDNSLSFKDFLNSIMKNSMSLLRHQKYCYQNILEDLRKKQHDLKSLYKIIISYQITKMNKGQESIPHESVWYFNNSTSNDIDINIFDLNDTNELNIAYDYNVEKYTAQDIKNIHMRILHIIEQVLENENCLEKDIEIVTKEEKDKILNEFNNTYADYPKDKTIADLFEEQVKKSPDNIAIIFGEQKLTYKELNEKANILASKLIKNGIEVGKTIGIRLERSLNMIISIFACIKAGITYVLIEKSLPNERVQYILKDSDSVAIITNKNLNNSNFNIKTILIDDDKIDTYNSLVIDKKIQKQNERLSIIYTSGSTGNPKGVILRQKGFVNFIFAMNDEMNLEICNKFISHASVSFDMFQVELYCPILNGKTLYLTNDIQQKDPISISDIIIKNKIDFMLTTPSKIELLLTNDKLSECLSYIKVFSLGGEVFTSSLYNRMRARTKGNIYNAYGPTEITACCTNKKIEDEDNINIGKPIPNVQVYILDKQLSLCPIGMIGELCVAGEGLAEGYINNKERTNKSFVNVKSINKKVYRTGDLAKFNDKGEIEYIGRNDFQVKLHGQRIELGEIEKKILNIKSIKNVCVCVKAVQNRNILSAYYTADTSINSKEIKKILQKELPEYMVPTYFLQLDELPLTMNGKIDRKQLPDPILESNKNAKFTKPKNKTEETILKIFKKLLKIKEISTTDNFFELGGDSLLAINLTTYIYESLKARINIKNIFENPTIEELSNLIIDTENKIEDTEKIEKTEEREYYPTSSAQKRMYYASSLDGDNTLLYNIAGGIILDQKPNTNKLEQCINKIIERHESLRTYFEVIDGNIVQKILKKVDFKLDVENSNTSNIDELFNNFVKPFNLNTAPLFDAKVINLKNNKSLLLFNMHHIISDGVSVSILIDELCKLYNNSKDLPKLNISYKDFAVWENNKLKSEKFNKDKEFWVSQFNDEIPLLNMPTNYSRPTVQSFEGDNVYYSIDKSLTIKINELAKKFGITPYMLLLSVYYILLYKYTGQNDIVIGTPIVGRKNSQLSNVIGMFVNSLALRNKIDSSLSFKDFSNKIKENCLNAFEHQTYPFDELIKALEIKRDTSRNPLFDTMFIYQNTGSINVDFDGIKAKNYVPKSSISKFDLSLEVIPENNELNLRFEYCTKLFNKEFIDRLSKHYINIIQAILNDNDIRIADINMISEEEKNQILFDFNNTSVDYPKNKTVIQLFEEQVKKNSNTTAIVFEEQKMTYKELNEKANMLGNYLKNIKENSVIGIMLDRSFETIISMLAVLKANCAYMLIDVNLPKDRILYMLENANSPLLITSSNIKDINFKNKLLIDKEDFSNLSKDNLSLKYDINNNLSVVYTSGSTGLPKGVLLQQQGMVNLILSYKKFIDIEKFNTFLSICSISFDMFAVEIFIPLLNGKTLILADEEEHKDPLSINKLIKSNNVEFMMITPSKIQLLFTSDDIANCLKCLKSIQLGGESLSSNLFEKLRKYTNAQICNEYGPSEITSCCSYKEIMSADNLNIGRPINNVQLYILNQDMNLCPIGIEGEICVSGDGVSKGYINNPTATNKAFVKNPFGEGMLYKTGDIGKYNSNGEIEYIGRKDFQIKMRGLRIELSEIEKQLLNIENIKNCAVIYKEEAENNSYLVGFFTSEKNIDVSYIRTELSKHLPLYMVPKYIIQIKDMPITRNGKINLKKLREYEISSNETLNYVAPENEIQKLFCTTWEKLLNTKVGITDNIFELGADSLLAIKFKVEMLSNNVDVQYADIFKYPTIKELSEDNHISVTEQSDNYDYTNINEVLEKNNVKNYKKILTSKNNNVLLLGSNGFVGMHILYNFIKHDNGNIYCIVRDKNKLSARTRFLDALHFYFGNELDDFVDNRIIILKGDITKENFGLNTQFYDDIVNNVSVVINSSANVKHYGNFKNFENINIGLTQKAIEFCENYKKRLIQISSTSVCGSVNTDKNISFSEANLYIGQKLDNVYIKSKFDAERIVLEHISKGLNAQILRLGNITNRYLDGKFQINPEENAFIGRIQSLIKLGAIPDYLLDTKLEFTPVDLCGYAIVLIMQNYIPDFSVFHVYNSNYITMKEFITLLKKCNINLKVVSKEKFNEIVKEVLMDNSKKDILSGIINELNLNNNIEINSNIDIISEFSKYFLNTIDFNWLKIDNVYIKKYIEYFKNIKFI